MLTTTNRALSSFSNEAVQQKNNVAAEEDFKMDLNQSRTVGAYLDSFESDKHYIKSMDFTGSGIKLVSPLRG
jgi:hypothetical protein